MTKYILIYFDLLLLHPNFQYFRGDQHIVCCTKGIDPKCACVSQIVLLIYFPINMPFYCEKMWREHMVMFFWCRLSKRKQGLILFRIPTSAISPLALWAFSKIWMMYIILICLLMGLCNCNMLTHGPKMKFLVSCTSLRDPC